MSAATILETTLANCSEFQTLVGAANATAAKAYIYTGIKDPFPSRPFALIDDSQPESRQGVAFGVSVGNGELRLIVGVDESGSEDAETGYERAKAIGTQIQTEIFDLAWQAGYLGVNTMTPERPAFMDRDESDGDPYWILEWVVSWGIAP